jgi:hypothetical protein
MTEQELQLHLYFPNKIRRETGTRGVARQPKQKSELPPDA